MSENRPEEEAYQPDQSHDRVDLSEGWIEKSAEVVHSTPSVDYVAPMMALDFDQEQDSDSGS